MSRENVEMVRRWFEVWSEDDWTAFEAIHDPHVVVLPPDDWPDGEVSIGRDAWIRQSMRLKDSWQTDRNELDEVLEAASHVLAGTRWITTGQDSGIEFETRLWAIFTLSPQGKVTRIEWFRDRSQALKAVGLSE
jgi:ketosteroid isomerase-like protein